MISHLQGTIILTNTVEASVYVCLGNVSYTVFVGQKFCTAAQIGSGVSLFIEHITKETGQTLYGFECFEKYLWFKSLLKVSGVGPKAAMNIMDSIATGDLTNAIINAEPAMLQSMGGIGEKIANRIVTDLKREPAKNAKILGGIQHIGVVPSTQAQQVPAQQVETKEGTPKQPNNAKAVNKGEAISALTNLGFEYNRAFAAVSGVIENSNTLEEAIKNALQKINS